ncbi:solute carrier family 35 member F5 [Lepeophtheirus salmonis]|uniref:solute carrier family 35 member F5 n=1 Tax=Lepeophtheirus salmonis TaxID=72036 RepID=UPI001AE29831|nr:solute carrier family 35 member F5-like [Lepeophtheirus salmonis]
MSEMLIFSSLSRGQRIIWGLFILLAVDIIWVASSELTKYIFKNEHFDKPFFSTYIKMSMLMLYLPGFCLYSPWRFQCENITRNRTHRRYNLVGGSEEEINPSDAEFAEEEDDENSLSHPVFLPVNHSTDDSEPETATTMSKKKSVRFSRVAEIRQMSGAYALHANIARLSYQASLRAQAALRRAASRLTLKEVAGLALTFTIPFFLGNFCYQMALKNTEAGIVNVLSSSSSFFTLLLGSVFPSNIESDRFTISKFFAVCFSIAGVVLVSFSDLQQELTVVPYGALWALAGSVCYSCYIVFLRRKVDHEDKLDAPMFFGFVGVFVFIFMWPFFFVLHFSGEEEFVWPSVKQWTFLAINGIIGTVISELLWLWGCFLTSSLVATIALGLNIPFSMFADILVKKVKYGPVFYIGSLPMFLSFFLVTILTHFNDWDPLLDFFKWIFSKCRRPSASLSNGNAYVFDRQERESLINQEDFGRDDDDQES